jgi:hypothetical protein
VRSPKFKPHPIPPKKKKIQKEPMFPFDLKEMTNVPDQR